MFEELFRISPDTTPSFAVTFENQNARGLLLRENGLRNCSNRPGHYNEPKPNKHDSRKIFVLPFAHSDSPFLFFNDRSFGKAVKPGGFETRRYIFCVICALCG